MILASLSSWFTPTTFICLFSRHKLHKLNVPERDEDSALSLSTQSGSGTLPVTHAGTLQVLFLLKVKLKPGLFIRAAQTP